MNGYCNIIIYKNCEIQPNRNFRVDDIDDYLLTLDTFNTKVEGVPVAIQGQFMKNQLNLTYKVIFEGGTILSFSSQSDLSFESNYNYNYLKATNVDTRALSSNPTRTANPVYYFIKGKRWISQNAIELELEMDVINTMLKGDQSSCFTDKSFIMREHKNRWEKVSGVANTYSPIIDYLSEGILPVLYKKFETPYYYEVSDSQLDTRSWYLIYRSQTTNEDSPIDIMACSDDNIVMAQGMSGYSGSKDPKQELGDKTWLILGSDGTGTPIHNNVGASISFTDKDGAHTLEINSVNTCIVISRRTIIIGTIGASGLYVSGVYKSGAFKNFRNIDFRRIYACRISPDSLVRTVQVGDTLAYITSAYVGSFPLDTSFITSYVSYTVCSIDEIDRTDPKLLKIVKLPYPFFKMEIVDNEMLVPAGWEIRQAETEGGDVVFPEILLYSDSSLVNAFTTTFTPATNYFTYRNPFAIFNNKVINDFGSSQILRDNQFETKFLHSDFCKQKIVYDSFSFDINAELYKVSQMKNLSFTLEFSITATMNSKMMFRIKGADDFHNYKNEVGDLQDYSGLLYIARNNELPVFNSAYLNYIRTGYNYDIKTKNRQLTSSIIGGVLSTIGSVASFASTAVSGPAGVAGGIGLATGATAMFSRAIFSTAQAEQNIAQKLKSTEMQGLSVAGSDDVDLMSIYTDENKLKYVLYEISDRMNLAIGDLFYYCGYTAGYSENPLIHINSRMWFNFIQCSPAYVNIDNYPQEMVDSLTAKFKDGITYLHHNQVVINNVTIPKYWDFKQIYENWEVLS